MADRRYEIAVFCCEGEATSLVARSSDADLVLTVRERLADLERERLGVARPPLRIVEPPDGAA